MPRAKCKIPCQYARREETRQLEGRKVSQLLEASENLVVVLMIV